jgi:hypothetical protein
VTVAAEAAGTDEIESNPQGPTAKVRDKYGASLSRANARDGKVR